MTEQRRERLRVGWVHAGPVAGLLVYLAASGVHTLAPVTSMVTAVQVLWMLFGVGMFLHALWGTEERSWIPRAGGLIVAVGVNLWWWTVYRYPLSGWTSAPHYLIYDPRIIRHSISFLFMWVMARSLHGRRGSFLLSWCVGWVFGLLCLQYSGHYSFMSGITYKSPPERQWGTIQNVLLYCSLWGMALVMAATAIDVLLHRRACGRRAANSGAGWYALALPVLLLGGMVWLVNDRVAQTYIWSYPEIARLYGQPPGALVCSSQALLLVALGLGIICGWWLIPRGNKWRGVSSEFLFSVLAAIAVLVYTLAWWWRTTSLAWQLLIVGVGLLALCANQPRPGRGFLPSDDTRLSTKALLAHFSSPLSGWKARRSGGRVWLAGPLILAGFVLISYVLTRVALGPLNPYSLANLFAHPERWIALLENLVWVLTYFTVLLLPPVALWSLCQRLTALWSPGALEQLRVAPYNGWDIWWGIILPAVRAPLALMLQGLFTTFALATLGFSILKRGELGVWYYSGFETTLAVGTTSFLAAGSIALFAARNSSVRGAHLFVVSVAAFMGVLSAIYFGRYLARFFDSVAGLYLPVCLLFFSIAYLPYLALRGVPRDIDGLFDESART